MAKHPNPLYWIGFSDRLGRDLELVLDVVAQKSGVAEVDQGIIHLKVEQMLDAPGLHGLKPLFFQEVKKDPPVPNGAHGQLSGSREEYFSPPIDDWQEALRDNGDIGALEPKKAVDLEKGRDSMDLAGVAKNGPAERGPVTTADGQDFLGMELKDALPRHGPDGKHAHRLRAGLKPVAAGCRHEHDLLVPERVLPEGPTKLELLPAGIRVREARQARWLQNPAFRRQAEAVKVLLDQPLQELKVNSLCLGDQAALLFG